MRTLAFVLLLPGNVLAAPEGGSAGEPSRAERRRAEEEDLERDMERGRRRYQDDEGYEEDDRRRRRRGDDYDDDEYYDDDRPRRRRHERRAQPRQPGNGLWVTGAAVGGAGLFFTLLAYPSLDDAFDAEFFFFIGYTMLATGASLLVNGLIRRHLWPADDKVRGVEIAYLAPIVRGRDTRYSAASGYRLRIVLDDVYYDWGIGFAAPVTYSSEPAIRFLSSDLGFGTHLSSGNPLFSAGGGVSLGWNFWGHENTGHFSPRLAPYAQIGLGNSGEGVKLGVQLRVAQSLFAADFFNGSTRFDSDAVRPFEASLRFMIGG